MDTDKNQSQPETKTEQGVSVPARERNNTLTMIKHLTAWVMIISAMLFALIGVLAIWEVFGTNASGTIGRAFASLVVIAFAALIVNVASRVAEGKR